MSSLDETVKIPCSRCGGEKKNHRVIKEHTNNYRETRDEPNEVGCYQICECLGCGQIRFRLLFTMDGMTDEDGTQFYDESVYPHPDMGQLKGINAFVLPNKVRDIYQETVASINAGNRILAGGGLRATVEAICKNQNIKGNNLDEKIGKLQEGGFLTPTQASLLHAERFIGNYSLHELATPDKEELILGLQILEGLLMTAYVLPYKGKRLESKRAKRKT